MDYTINEKKENSLLGRTEIVGIVKFEGTTPSNSQVAETIANELSKDVNLVVVKHVNTRFSHQDAVFDVVAYDSIEAKNKVEVMTKFLKKKAEEIAKKVEEEKKVTEEVKATEKSTEESASEEKKVEVKTDENPKEQAPSEEVKEAEA